MPTTRITVELNQSPETSLFTDAPKTRSGRVRRAQDFALLSECICGEVVSSEEVLANLEVIQCKRAGCETKWVSVLIFAVIFIYSHNLQYHLACVGLEYPIHSWTCDACEPDGQGGKQRCL